MAVFSFFILLELLGTTRQAPIQRLSCNAVNESSKDLDWAFINSCKNDSGDYWQGDMKLNDLQKQILKLDKPDVDHRAVITKNLRLFWTKKDSNNNIIVPYVYDSTISESSKPTIQEGFDAIANKTCLRISPREGDANYVRIFKGQGCYSYVGMQNGEQDLSLGNGCIWKRIVIHEFLHALGFLHEQSRPDRDNYVKILFENIDEDNQSNFETMEARFIDSKGVAYDLHSIMHYGSYYFSNNSNPTIVDVNTGETLQNVGRIFTNEDALQINLAYECEDTKTTCEWLPELYNQASILQVPDKNNPTVFNKGEQVDIKCPSDMVPDGPATSTCGQYGFFIPGSFKCKIPDVTTDTTATSSTNPDTTTTNILTTKQETSTNKVTTTLMTTTEGTTTKKTNPTTTIMTNPTTTIETNPTTTIKTNPTTTIMTNPTTTNSLTTKQETSTNKATTTLMTTTEGTTTKRTNPTTTIKTNTTTTLRATTTPAEPKETTVKSTTVTNNPIKTTTNPSTTTTSSFSSFIKQNNFLNVLLVCLCVFF